MSEYNNQSEEALVSEIQKKLVDVGEKNVTSDMARAVLQMARGEDVSIRKFNSNGGMVDVASQLKGEYGSNAWAGSSEAAVNADEGYDKTARALYLSNSNLTDYDESLKSKIEDKIGVKTEEVSKKVDTESGTKVLRVDSVEDGNYKLRLSDDTVVDSKDVVYDNPDQALIIESGIANGYDAESINKILALHESSNMRADQFMLAVNETINYGKINHNYDSISKSSMSAVLSDSERQFAYDIGRQLSANLTKAEQAEIEKSLMAIPYKQGRITLPKSYKSMTARQKASISAVARIVADTTKNNVVFYESVLKDGKRVFAEDVFNKKADDPAPHGMYDRSTGTVYLDINAGNKGEGAILYTAAHEFTHFMRQYSPGDFKALSDFVVNEMSKRGINVDRLIQEQYEKGKKGNSKFTKEDALEEVIADSMQGMLTNTNALENLINKDNVDKPWYKKLKEFIHNLLNKVKALYKDLDPYSEEGKYVLKMKDSLQQIEDLFTQGLKNAGENYSRSGEVDFNSSIMQSDRNDFSKALTSEEWKKYNNAITSGVDAGLRINDHSILVECEKGDYAYKLVIYDNTFEENPINAVYGIGKSSEPTTTNNFDEKYISEFITELEDRNYDNKQVFERILRPYSKNVGRVLGRYSSRDNRFIRYGRKISQSGANPQNQSNGAGASGTNQTNVKFDLRDNEYLELAKNPEQNREKLQRMLYKVAMENGYPVEAYHGTARADRVGYVFLPERATSGPMAFFTDNEKIAENYARDKADTSLAYDEEYDDYYTQFRVNYNGKSVSVSDLWNKLSLAERNEIKKRAEHITFDWDNNEENIIYNESNKYGLGNFDDYTIKMNGGNYLKALTQSWLEDGNLFNEEEKFLKVLQLAGLKQNVEYRNPNMRNEKVYHAFLAINNPFDTNTMYDGGFVESLTEWYNGIDTEQYDTESNGADLWDKNNQTFDSWIEKAEDDIENNSTHAWTSIPDFVTDYLKSKGYDGIKDSGGKGGGEHHNVWIPFNSSQVKSADLVTYDDNGKVIPLSERFNENNDDIRYSARDYSYDTLISKPDMKITTIDTSKTFNRADTVYYAKKNAAQFGKQHEDGRVSVFVDDVGIDIIVGRKSILHSLDRRLNIVAPVAEKVGEILKNSIRINELSTRENNINKTYALIGFAENQNREPYIVSFVVNSYNNEVMSMDVLYSINAKKESAVLNAPKVSTPSTDSTISISDLLDYVNDYFPDILPEDVLKHYGYSERPEGNLGKSALYSHRDTDAIKRLEKVNRQLAKENSILKEDLANVRELKRLQGKITHGQIFKKSSLDAVARKLIRDNYAQGNAVEFANILRPAYEYILSGEEITMESIREKMQPALDWLKENQKPIKEVRTDEAQEILDQLRKTSVKLTSAQMEEAKSQYGTYGDFRRRLFGKINISNNAITDLDQMWGELCSTYPGYFDPDVNEGDMVEALVNAIDTLQTSYDYYEGEERLSEQEMFNNLYDGFWNVATLYTVADKNQRDINILKSKHREQMDALKQSHADKLSQMRQEKAEAVKKVREQKNEAMAKKQRELMDRYAKSQADRIGRRDRAVYRNKIKKVVKELNDYLLTNSKEKHVPKAMQAAVAEALNIVDMDTLNAERKFNGYTDENGVYHKGLNQLIDEATDPEVRDALIEKAKKLQHADYGLQEKITKLKDAYNQLKEDNTSDFQFDHNVALMIESTAEYVKGTSLASMNLDQLGDVYKMYRMVLKVIRDANKAFKMGRTATINELGSNVMHETIEAGGVHKKFAKVTELTRKLKWEDFKPIYAVKAIGSKTLLDLFKNVRAGEDTWYRDVNEARNFRRATAKKYGYKNWDMDKPFTFKSGTGKEFQLNLQQMMSIYAYSKRDKADLHLRIGGIVFDSATEVVEKKKGIPIKYKVNTAEAFKISAETLADIKRELKPEQKAFVDTMQTYLSKVMGAKGNEVSNAMYDIDLFGEENYFPIKSAKQFLFEQNEVAGEVRIKNSGFTKKTQKFANNPIILKGFMDVWSEHVDDMSMYHAFALPLEDFNRVFNYHSQSDEFVDEEAVKTAIQNAYGEQATAYLRQMIIDLNGGTRSNPGTELGNKLTSLFKKGAVFASASVVIQQPSAIGRAMAYISPKYFVRTLPSSWNAKAHSADWAEVKKYAPVAGIKEMGYFDTNMGRQTTDWIMADEYETLGEKAKAIFTDSDYRDELLSKAPALADEVTWVHIWNAVKREVADKQNLKFGSEEHLKASGDRFTEVIVNTQVYDSVLSRSGLMRSKDTGVKMATAFMGEPTTSLNMLQNALLEGRRGNRPQARREVGAVLASMILNSILVSFVFAARDDDDEKSYWEKYIGELTGSTLDAINPLSLMPYVKDIISIVQGYDVERSDMAVISALWNAWQNLQKESVSPYRKVEDFAGAICNLFGLPFKNIMRDVRGINNILKTIVNENETTPEGMWDAVKNELPFTENTSGNIYKAIVEGNPEKLAKLRKAYKTDKAYQSAVRQALQDNDGRIHTAAEERLSGNLNNYMKKAKEIKAEGKFSQDDIVAAINSEISFFNGKIKEAYGSDKDSKEYKTAISELKERGFSDEIIKKYIADYEPEEESDPEYKGYFKKSDLISAYTNDLSYVPIIKQDLIDTDVKNGKTLDKATESANKKIEDTIEESVCEGEISDDQAAKILVDYADCEEDEANNKIRYFKFKNRNPDTDIKIETVNRFYDEVAEFGIDEEYFIEFWNKADQCKGVDANGDGRADNGTVQSEIFKLIDSLPITASQKDALYLTKYKKTYLYKAPWH